MSRRRKWTLDALERRDLLSITPLINSPGWIQTSATSTAGTSTASDSALTLDPTTGIVSNNTLGGSGITTDVSPPRPGEAVARQFVAKFKGKVVELPPRLFDQTHQFYVVGPGQSSAFLHGTMQLDYFTPNSQPISVVDPNSGQTLVESATTTTGTISMSDRSTQSGVVILGNLVGSTTAEDAKGRPTHFTLSINGGGGSGGIYASSTGSGTVDISYKGNVATVTVKASIFTSGVGNQLDILQSNTHR